jgi:hypothetical protein
LPERPHCGARWRRHDCALQCLRGRLEVRLPQSLRIDLPNRRTSVQPINAMLNFSSSRSSVSIRRRAERTELDRIRENPHRTVSSEARPQGFI